MACGKIGKISISRLLMGGNLIGGWAHSRDLMYVSSLFKAYNTEAKVFETLANCRAVRHQHGPDRSRCASAVVQKYKPERGGKIQTMVCFAPEADKAKMRDLVKKLVDEGATLLYTHGEATDHLTRAGKIDVLGQAMELIKEQGVPAGIGSHSLETPIACEKGKVNADFYVKTFHMDRYWSATPQEKREEWCWYKPQSAEHDGFHDNMWCLDPEKTAAFMETVEQALGGLQGDGGRGHPRRGWPSPTPSATGPISSSPACSISRSRTT